MELGETSILFDVALSCHKVKFYTLAGFACTRHEWAGINNMDADLSTIDKLIVGFKDNGYDVTTIVYCLPCEGCVTTTK